MKTPQYSDLACQHVAEPRVVCGQQKFPPVEHHYQNSNLPTGCGRPATFRSPAFFKLSSDYFAEEAARDFVADTGVFAALILTAALPIANSVQAVATLIHTAGVL